MSKRPRSDGGSSSGPEDDPDDEPAASQDFPAGMGPGLEEEEDGEDLIGDDMGADYRALGAMDEYEADGLDEAEYGDMDARARADAEAILEARDRRERSSRMPQALLTSDDDEGGEERPARRRRSQRGEMADDGADADEAMFEEAFADDDVSGLNLEDYNVPLTEWISKDTVGDEIKRRFRQFLRTFQGRGAVAAGDNSNPVYANKVQQMCANNEESLEVSYLDMSHAVPILAIWVADCPREMLKLLDEAAMAVVRMSTMYPKYEQIHPIIHVRVTDLPIHDSIRELRQVHMGCLVKISGVVTRRSAVFPQLKICKYNCTNCGYVMGPYTVNGAETKMAGVQCPACQAKGPYTLNTEQTVYCNYQKLTLQESPGSVPAGRLPRHKEVVLLWDLIDVARPGEEIEVTGVYTCNLDNSLNRKSGFPVFSTVVEANFVQKKEELMAAHALNEDDRNEILKMAKDPQIQQKIIASIAPSIFGHLDIKTAVALSMFGGCSKNVNGKHRLRGDINVLLLGDPGTAKSQFLKYVEKTSPRAVYTTGQGASAVGLTASVHKDSVTREWTLEGGALVLADKGVCLIDEFDKMNDADRTSIHEAMEQQSISISKAGIVTTLQARCAVIAAANPVKGRYDGAVSFAENVELSEPILSRFDCICVVKDTVDPVLDERLAEFVVDSHKKSHPTTQKEAGHDASQSQNLTSQAANGANPDAIPQPLLRKYIMYARQHTKPVLQDLDQGKITRVYSELRQMSAQGGVSIAVRHIESIIRMSEASARMHLRDQVRDDDVDLAISVLLNSVIRAQKYAVAREMEKKFRPYLSQKKDANELLDFALRRLFQQASQLHMMKAAGAMGADKAVQVELEAFEARARELNINDLSQFFASPVFRGSGFRRAKEDGIDVIVRQDA